MSTLAQYQEPAHPYPVRSGQLLAARAEALFTSDLSAQGAYTHIEVAAAIRRAIGTHNGIRGCAGEVAAAYGEHPETAARRMRWARATIEGCYASRLAAGINAPAASPVTAGMWSR